MGGFFLGEICLEILNRGITNREVYQLGNLRNMWLGLIVEIRKYVARCLMLLLLAPGKA